MRLGPVLEPVPAAARAGLANAREGEAGVGLGVDAAGVEEAVVGVAHGVVAEEVEAVVDVLGYQVGGGGAVGAGGVEGFAEGDL